MIVDHTSENTLEGSFHVTLSLIQGLIYPNFVGYLFKDMVWQLSSLVCQTVDVFSKSKVEQILLMG